MLRNVGHTIKIIAYIVLIIALIAIVIGIVGSFTTNSPIRQAQQWTIFLLAIVYAVSAVVLYGFGQLIENSHRIAGSLGSQDGESPDAGGISRDEGNEIGNTSA